MAKQIKLKFIKENDLLLVDEFTLVAKTCGIVDLKFNEASAGSVLDTIAQSGRVPKGTTNVYLQMPNEDNYTQYSLPSLQQAA